MPGAQREGGGQARTAPATTLVGLAVYLGLGLGLAGSGCGGDDEPASVQSHTSVDKAPSGGGDLVSEGPDSYPEVVGTVQAELAAEPGPDADAAQRLPVCVVLGRP
jgi:hypothetical protein